MNRQPPRSVQRAVRLAYAGALAGALLLLSRPSAAQYAPRPPASDTVNDFGLTELGVTRIGYSSGTHVGGGLAFSYRTSAGFGGDFLQVDITQRIDTPEMGFRISPFVFIVALWNESIWQGGFLRWSLIDIGADYVTGTGKGDDDDVAFGTAVSVGYSFELSRGVALRLLEVGGFFGGLAKGQRDDGSPRLIFDGGLTLGAGVTFR